MILFFTFSCFAEGAVLLGRQTFFVRLFLLFLVRVVRMETPPRYGRMKDIAVLVKSEKKEYRVEKKR